MGAGSSLGRREGRCSLAAAEGGREGGKLVTGVLVSRCLGSPPLSHWVEHTSKSPCLDCPATLDPSAVALTHQHCPHQAEHAEWSSGQRGPRVERWGVPGRTLSDSESCLPVLLATSGGCPAGCGFPLMSPLQAGFLGPPKCPLSWDAVHLLPRRHFRESA